MSNLGRLEHAPWAFLLPVGPLHPLMRNAVIGDTFARFLVPPFYPLREQWRSAPELVPAPFSATSARELDFFQHVCFLRVSHPFFFPLRTTLLCLVLACWPRTPSKGIFAPPKATESKEVHLPDDALKGSSFFFSFGSAFGDISPS